MRSVIAHAAAAATLAGFIALPGAAFADSKSDSYLQHVADCEVLMIVDPAAHAEKCLPSTVPPDNSSLSTPVSDFGIVRPPCPI